jgi:hypothetical protein
MYIHMCWTKAHNALYLRHLKMPCLEKTYICWVWLPFVELYGRPRIKRVLRKSLLITLMKLCMLHVLLWACLYPENTQQAINEGVDLMIRTTIKLLGKQNKERRLLLTDGRYSSEDSDDRGGSGAA